MCAGSEGCINELSSSSPVKCRALSGALSHCEYVQGASEARLKLVKSDSKTGINILRLHLIVTGQPSLEGLQGWRCDDMLRQLVPKAYPGWKKGAPVSVGPTVWW